MCSKENGPSLSHEDNVAVSPRVSSPRSPASTQSDAMVKIIPEVNMRPPVSRAADYHSDSAESLQEIPVSSTRVGSLYTCTPRQASYQTYTPSPHAVRQSLDKQRGVREMSAEYDTARFNGDMQDSNVSIKLRETASGHPNGSIDYWKGHEALSLTPINRRRHNEVPPLDLSSFNEDSDTMDGINDRPKKSSGKKTRKKRHKPDNTF